MNIKCCIGILVVSILLSCEKNNTAPDIENNLLDNKPEIPQNTDIDINGDSVTDLRIKYNEWVADGADTSFYGISGKINPSPYNEILRTSDYQYFMHEAGDTVFREESDSLVWDSERFASSFGVIWITASENGNWDTEWEWPSDADSVDNYLLFKINNINSPLIGWINLKLDSENGRIYVVGYGTSEQDHIIVGR